MSTMCGSEDMGLNGSVKTCSKELASSPISGLVMRNLRRSNDSEENEDDDDELERLIENGDLGDDEFEINFKPCNRFNPANAYANNGNTQIFGGPNNAAFKMQGQFALCSSEAMVSKNEATNEPLMCEGLTEKDVLPELNCTRS